MKIKAFSILAAVTLLLLNTGCSRLSLPNNPVVTEAPVSEDPSQLPPATALPQAAATCVPQPVGSCTTPGPDEPVEVVGDIPYTSPFFLNTISEPYVLLEDEAGFVTRDKEFRFSLESQAIGPVVLDEDMKLSYTLSLPSVPQATFVDVDNDGTNDTGLQVFAVAYWSNTWGDPFLEERDGKGWSTAYTSAITDPENDDEIVGGKLIVWAPDDEQGFPSGFGADGKLFTQDDPIILVPAGYSLVDLESEPFRVYKEPRPDLTLNEGAGAVKDYSGMNFGEAFETLFEKASREYPFTEEKSIDWGALYQELRPQFDRVQTNQEFYAAMRSFVLRIPDGHVNLALNSEIFFANYGGGFGLVLDQLSDQRLIARRVLPQMSADSAGIQAGAEILSWDGQPVSEALAQVTPGFGPYSTEHTRRQAQVSFLARTRPDTPVRVEFKNPGSAQTQEVELRAVTEYDSLFLTIPSFSADVLEMPIVGYVLPGQGLGYIRINTFSDDYSLMAKLWDRYIQNMIDNEVPGLIIDLRTNPGGSLGLAMDFAGYFFDQEIVLYENYYYSESRDQFEPTGYPTRIRPAETRYEGPIAVLVSSECVSACEGFAYALQHDQRATVIGHYPTAGAFGEVGLGQYKLPGDLSIQFPTGRPVAPDGSVVIEGQGVLLDVTVPVTEDSALGRLDAILEAAVQHLNEAIR